MKPALEFLAPDAHLTCLDGLRGVAALWVLLSHAQILTGMRFLPILSWGGVAVDLFMMLSGFLMAHHYILRREAEPWTSPRTVWRFWCRRYFRIAPLYYLALIVALTAGPLIGNYRDAIASVWPATATSAQRYLDQSLPNLAAHVSFLFGFSPDYAFRTPLPDWSIGLEMQFYLVFPLLMFAFVRIGLLETTLASIAACFLFRYMAPDFVGRFEMPALLPLKLHVFLVGMWLAIGRNTARKAGAVFVACLLSLFSYVTDGLLMTLFQTGMAMAIFLLVDDLPLLRGGALGRLVGLARALFANRMAIYLGDASYAVYLLHLLILIPICGMLAAQPRYLALGQGARFALVVLIVLPLAYFLASLLYRYVEKPGIRFGKRLLQNGVKPNPGVGEVVE